MGADFLTDIPSEFPERVSVVVVMSFYNISLLIQFSVRILLLALNPAEVVATANFCSLLGSDLDELAT